MNIIMISGKQGSGKTSTADALAKSLSSEGFIVYRTRFAKVLYEIHDAVKGVLAQYGVQRPTKDSRLLQLIGTEYGRETIESDIWVKLMLADIEKRIKEGGPVDHVIVDDMRFKNEFHIPYEYAKANGHEIVRVRLEADRDVRKARCDGWRDTEFHLSETELDDFVNNFELVVHTDSALQLNNVVEIIKEMLNNK